MADPAGFLKYSRRVVQSRPVDERIHDWREVHGAPDDALLHEQAARCMDCGVPFCHVGCPVANLIPDFNDLTHRGRMREALDRLHATNNFPEFTGRLCPAPCESACVLGYNQSPVTIKQIEHAIIEEGFAQGWVVPEPPAQRTGRTVAIVGSGPSGLAAAQQLNRAGHTVTVLERSDRIGGLLRYGIPEFKLEKSILDRRLRILEEEGILFRTGVDVGVDITAEELRAQYDAVCLAGGSTIPRDLGIPGRDLQGIHFAMDYLPQQNRINAGDTIADRTRICAHGQRVVIIGGGDTGADCLGTAIRQGARDIVQIELLPKPPAERDATMPWPTYPMILRTSSAHEEGGRRDWAINTRAFLGEQGRVTGLQCVRVEFGPRDADGRRPMSELEQSEFILEADLVLLAMGFLHPQRSGLLDALGVRLDPRGNVWTDERRMTSVRGVFAAGDMRRGQSLIVWAIAEGRAAAAGIDAFLMEESRLP
ncbi:MAG: glutamate synthase subunit beta [Chthonomonadales bacterium]|nr:glutamate synthase subunit beta [Chthonomonadales bacterium]